MSSPVPDHSGARFRAGRRPARPPQAPESALAVFDMMLQRHGRAGYKPRSPDTGVLAAGFTRIGATARPKNGSKPFVWWGVARDEQPLP